MTTDLYMRIGSETKTFVATAVLQLVEAGRIRLDDPIGRYLKGIPNGDRVTIRQLGEMRSGIASYTSNPSWLAAYLADPMRTWKPRELLASAFSLGPAFAPGSAFEYSNANYIILGLLVEKLSGESLPAYLRRHVLRPLRLRHTSFPLTSAFPKPHATGYAAQTPTGTVANSTYWSPSALWAAGAMISKLGDLRIWAKAVATGALLSPRLQRQRERFLPIPGLAPARYGFGLFQVNGWIGHDGEVPGYESLTVYLPAKRMTMVILLNDDINPGGVELSMLLGEAVTRVVSPGHVFRFGPPPPPGIQAGVSPDHVLQPGLLGELELP